MGSPPKDDDEVYARLSKHVTPEKSVSSRSIGPFSHKPTTPGRSASRKRCQVPRLSTHSTTNLHCWCACVPSLEACDNECVKKS